MMNMDEIMEKILADRELYGNGGVILSGGDPLMHLEYEATFAFLKKAAKEGYFEELIRKYLLENPHGCIMTLVPKKGLAAQREKELEEIVGYFYFNPLRFSNGSIEGSCPLNFW